jgi:plasmid replication initiation protein
MNTDEKALVVRQSNELIEASYKIASIGEGRLIRMLIAQITPDDEDFKTYRIGITDFARFFGLSKESNSIYELIKKSADELAGRRIMLEKDGSWLRLNWLSSAEYIRGSGHIEVRFDKALKPYLLGLKGYFTQYELDKVVNFKSGYAMRIFELLKKEQFKANGQGYFKRSFEYDELRELLGIGKKEYERIIDFKRYIVDSSVKEINANPDINILQVDYPKTGRKISHVVFHCEKAKQLQLDIDEPPPKFEEVTKEKEHPDDVKQLIAFGIAEETAYKWRKKYGVARVIRNLGFVTAKKNAGKVKDDLAGYVASAIAKDYGQGWEDKAKTQQEEATAKAEEERNRKEEEARKEAKKKEESDALWASFLEWKPEEREALIRALLEGKPATLQIYERKGEDTAVVRSLVIQHLKQ